MVLPLCFDPNDIRLKSHSDGQGRHFDLRKSLAGEQEHAGSDEENCHPSRASAWTRRNVILRMFQVLDLKNRVPGLCYDIVTRATWFCVHSFRY
jgi:hypothetical protein